MLRTIKHNYIRGRLFGYSATCASAVVTELIGEQEGTFSSTGTGQLTLVVGDKCNRLPVAVATPWTDIAPGGYTALTLAPTATNLYTINNNPSAAGDDGTVDVLSIGHYHDSSDRVQAQRLLTTGHGARVVTFKVKGTGTASLQSGGYDGTLTDNGTGDYTITFKRGFNRLPVVVATCIGTTALNAQIESKSLSSVRIKTFNASGTATDADFYVAVLGWNSVVEAPRKWVAVKSPQLRARVETFSIDVVSGTPTLAIGSNAGTITDNGVGDYSITYTKPFAREPIVLMSSYHRCQARPESSTTAARLFASNAAGSAVDTGLVNVVVFGYDYDGELY
jgi:hypothetical protein